MAKVWPANDVEILHIHRQHLIRLSFVMEFIESVPWKQYLLTTKNASEMLLFDLQVYRLYYWDIF